MDSDVFCLMFHGFGPGGPFPHLFSAQIKRTISILVGRLNLASHHTKHERRTPLRTHLLKFLLNILSRCCIELCLRWPWLLGH